MSSSLSVRPFCSCAPVRTARRCTRVVVAPVASTKGFGDPKKEQAKQQQPSSTSAPTSVNTPEPVPPRKVIRETPQVVVDRMFRRIVTFTMVPIFTGMALLPLFYYLRVVMDIEYPIWVVYISQVLTFGGGLVGITYGALSASWDPSREGSAFGFTEAKANIAIILNNNKNNQQ